MRLVLKLRLSSLNILLLLACLQTISGASDYKCIVKGGKCTTSRRCYGGSFVTNHCAGSSNRKCCIKRNGDAKCSAVGGSCRLTSQGCSGGSFQSNLCAGVSYRKCCIKRSSTGGSGNKCTSKRGRCQSTKQRCSGGHYEKNLCTGGYGTRCCVPGGTRGGTCSSSSAKRYACDVLNHHKAGRLTLASGHPSGVPDDAHPLRNIQDACNGRQVLRSSYTCKECYKGAPGGYVCLSSKLLQYISSLTRYGRVYITSIAGACHSCSSRHYRGLAVDMSRTSSYSSLMRACRNLGGIAIDEKSHIHCQF